MSDGFITAITSVALAIIGVATVAAVLSQKSNTSQVISAATGGFGTDLLAALSPITGTVPNIQQQF